VAGLGNVLLMDDGVGVHAIEQLRKDPPPHACLAGVGTAVLYALDLIEWADKIIAIDAVKAGGPPGTLYAFDGDGAAERDHPVSLHELNLLGALRLLGPDHPRPEIVIVGVEPETIDYGLELSPAVQAALPQVALAVREIVDVWDQNPDALNIEELRGAMAWR